MAPDRTTNSVAGGVRTRFVTNGRTVGWLRIFWSYHSKPHAHAQAAAFESRSQNFLAASWTNGLRATSRSFSPMLNRPTLAPRSAFVCRPFYKTRWPNFNAPSGTGQRSRPVGKPRSANTSHELNFQNMAHNSGTPHNSEDTVLNS